MTDRIGKLLERVAERMIVDVVPDEDGYISKSEILAALEARLGPLLHAGQATQDHIDVHNCSSCARCEDRYDAAMRVALATLEGK